MAFARKKGQTSRASYVRSTLTYTHSEQTQLQDKQTHLSMPMSDDRESRAVELANDAVKLVASGQAEVHNPVC